MTNRRFQQLFLLTHTLIFTWHCRVCRTCLQHITVDLVATVVQNVQVCQTTTHPRCYSIFWCCVMLGSTITDWFSTIGSIWSPYLRGGMTYSNGILTVRQYGLYYIYTQLWFNHKSGNSGYGYFSIDVNGSVRAFSHQFSYDQYHTYYMGRLLQLQKGDGISIVIRSGGNLLNTHNEHSFFGAFWLP